MLKHILLLQYLWLRKESGTQANVREMGREENSFIKAVQVGSPPLQRSVLNKYSSSISLIPMMSLTQLN